MKDELLEFWNTAPLAWASDDPATIHLPARRVSPAFFFKRIDLREGRYIIGRQFKIGKSLT